ncbi:GHMP family kinase ATP-binding protein [Paractinoplanes hotanensis]|uniref:Kinase n=1 Tax=Paractinoplanes hotanensis TaxID=2906497 RepID=A0ABT0YAP3_9ACTN|nr:kinase [Actinoplanes hotanensis]MCM4083109.1 kinase [Actinoplanes hotanensis]
MSTAARAGTRAPTGTGVSSAFGTFGELLQGVLPDGVDFLVTLPIARWATASFETRAAPAVEVRPAHKTKAHQLVTAMLEAYDVRVGGRLTLSGTIPEGKGLASSSADLVATARAVANAIGVRLTGGDIERFLRDIEPTDGVMYPEVVAFEHRVVRLRARLGPLPPLTIVGVDEGGTVDTIAFNRIPKPFTADVRAEYARLLGDLEAAVPMNDLVALGRVATRSAYLNQALRPKRTLTAMAAVCAEVGGIGLAVAHSGTAIGILLPHQAPGYERRLDLAVRRCAALGDQVLLYHSLSVNPT